MPAWECAQSINNKTREFYSKCTLIINLHVATNSARNCSWQLAIFQQFQHLAGQNLIWLAKFPVHFQWDSNQ